MYKCENSKLKQCERALLLPHPISIGAVAQSWPGCHFLDEENKDDEDKQILLK